MNSVYIFTNFCLSNITFHEIAAVYGRKIIFKSLLKNVSKLLSTSDFMSSDHTVIFTELIP